MTTKKKLLLLLAVVLALALAVVGAGWKWSGKTHKIAGWTWDETALHYVYSSDVEV